MARKREDHAPPSTPDKKLNHPSGWCMDEDHNNCKYQFTFGKCGCDCHKETK
jgi:hypothetical protein